MNQAEWEIYIYIQETSSSEQETKMQDPSLQPSTSQAQFVPAMFMPYTEGPKMDWTVNDGLFHRFLKWKLKCENILDCELAMFSESKKCKPFIAWGGNFGMDQYVSWCLPTDELSLDTIWSKYEDFANLKQMKLEQDLTCLQHSTRVTDLLMSGIMQYKLKCVLLNTHKKLPRSCIMTSFGFS